MYSGFTIRCGGPGTCLDCTYDAYKAFREIAFRNSSLHLVDNLTPEKEEVVDVSTTKTIEPKTFSRKPFEVQAVQVTEENFEAVAKWCGGKIVTVQGSESTTVQAAPDRYIQVLVSRPMTRRQTEARLGDWILYASKGYKVYGNRPFIKNFNEKSGDILVSLDDEDGDADY